MRIGFLILNHRPPAQLLRLMATIRLELPSSPIVVHHDHFRASLDASAIDAIDDAHLLTSPSPVVWGDFSIVDACWRSLAWMSEHLDFDWVVLLSGQDYPIKSLATLGEYLAGLQSDAVLRAAPIHDLGSHQDLSRRYLYQYRPGTGQPSGPVRSLLRRSSGPFVDIINASQSRLHIYKLPIYLPRRVGWRSQSPPFTKDFPCWQGTMWLGLSRTALDYLLASIRRRPDYVDYYRHTIIPDESATATLLCNAPGLRIKPVNLHFARWTDPARGHPDTFSAADFTELLAAREYFARKFDITYDAQIFDALDGALAESRASPLH
jgi:hypothetical protein